jgi:thymidylate synthase (FAD)
MNIITEPTVTVMGEFRFRPHPLHHVPLGWETQVGGNYVALGAHAAKGCYDSFGYSGRACDENQREVLQQAHGSVLEHLSIPVYIEGITRACSMELNRHRPLAISQRSTRYTEEGDASIVLEPYFAQLYETYGFENGPRRAAYQAAARSCGGPSAKNISSMRLLDRHISIQLDALDGYERQVEMLMALNPYGLEKRDLRKWARGKARNVLPHGLETRGMYTANLRSWRWIIEKRSEASAEDEVRRLAVHLYHALSAEAPLYFGDFTVGPVVRGIPVLTPRHSKV